MSKYLDLLKWPIAGIALIGTVLNIHHNPTCFVLWTISNTFLCIRNARLREWSQSALFAVYACLAVWGLLAWRGVAL